MTISDANYGAELITDKGRVLKYDAAECMVNHLREGAPPQAGLFLIAYDVPGQLFPVDSLAFVISPEFRSPMGANLAAFRHRQNLNAEHRANVLSWKEVMEKAGR